MFFEYALDPALLANWKDFRYYVEKFGWSQGRLISRYPKHWKRLVYEALKHCGDVEKTKIVERLKEKEIDNRLVKRPDSNYQSNNPWAENAVAEHDRLSFHAIISQGNKHDHTVVLVGDNLDENEPLWQSPNRVVPQRAGEFSVKLDLLLIASERIKFIDPYFKPDLPRFTSVLEKLLRTAYSARRREKNLRAELHTSIERFFRRSDRETENRRAEDEERIAQNLTDDCSKILPKYLPRGVSLFVFIWQEKPGGEKIHNRYILTEKGGVAFGAGLDESSHDSEATDDLNRLSEDQHSTRWAQYNRDSAAFALIGNPVEIKGIQPPGNLRPG
jgi:hypothetical protein